VSTTRVARFHRTGGPDVLSIDEVPLPQPTGNEVRIRVQALALNRADTLWRAGTYIEEPILPSRIGYDIAGVVEATGPEVQKLRIGDRVSSFPAASVQRYGNHGETALYPEYGLLKYPERLAPHEAVAVNTGLFTAYFPLVEIAGIRPSQYVVATAGGSSTAQAALQIARKVGAKTIGTTRTAAKRRELLDSGFDHVIVTTGEDVTKRILEITDGTGADLIYDPIAGPGLEALAAATKPLGHLVVYGALGAVTETTPLPLWALFTRTVKLHAGYKVFDFTGHAGLAIPRNEKATERAKQFILEGLAAGDFQPRIDRIFDGLDQYADAHRYMESNAQTGKIVVRLAS
jgi:NADPH:quinone reductase-like Zn-dependent oxidoreductase